MLLAHEWVSSTGGAEKVFDRFRNIFNGAAAYCLWNDLIEPPDRPLVESWLAHSPLRKSKVLALPLMPAVWRTVPLGSHESVLVSSHVFAHHLAGRAAREGRRALAYVHTPARYIWAPEVEPRGNLRRARLGQPILRRIDRSITHPDVSYAANSEFIRERIRRAWDQDAIVIYPPVDVSTIQDVTSWQSQLTGIEQRFLDELPQAFVLAASRLVAYKRLDLAIKVGEQLGLPVVIAGSGPDEAVLRGQASVAAVPVTFAGRVSDALLYALYGRASLFAFLAVEDFGIMAVEAIAAGTPTLVSGVGGAAESVTRLGGGSVVADIESPRERKLAAEGALGIDMTQAVAGALSFNSTEFDTAILKWAGTAS